MDADICRSLSCPLGQMTRNDPRYRPGRKPCVRLVCSLARWLACSFSPISGRIVRPHFSPRGALEKEWTVEPSGVVIENSWRGREKCEPSLAPDGDKPIQLCFLSSITLLANLGPESHRREAFINQISISCQFRRDRSSLLVIS